MVRMFSGVISDKMTSRKAAITAGFAMGAAAKFGMSAAATTMQLFVTKAMDRLGNGVQVGYSSRGWGRNFRVECPGQGLLLRARV